MAIPQILVDHIKDGQVVLFLGAGASIGATNSKKESPLIGSDLAKVISKEFLKGKYDKAPLPQVAEFAISETDLFTFQEFIKSIFTEFHPADFHKLIPKFYWKAIATTNYDLIIERAYDEIQNSCQKLFVFKKNGERIERILTSPNNVIYYKLHGCITDINDKKVPLILTPDQYVVHREGRDRLFDRLKGLSYEFPFLFVGSNLYDSDIRQILMELTYLGEARPRYYLVKPCITEVEGRFWETKKITCINLSFQDFLAQLDDKIPQHVRFSVSISSKLEHPVFKKYHIPESAKPSESLLTFLERDVEYIHKALKAEDIDPKYFYRGYFTDWSPIINELDVRRTITDNILSGVFLASEEEKRNRVEFYLLKGHAGSGKTVILKRLSWDASVNFDCLCLSLKNISYPDYEPLHELSNLTKKRIFLFIDPVNEYLEIIEKFILKAQKDNLPLTIIGAERHNEWNIQCECLKPYVTDEYELAYLNLKEIDELIKLLTRHKSLGHLADLPYEQQKEELSKKAGRQLLVALHEATLGKPFSDIVLDEYQSITSLQAQSLYLTVCILHRFGIPTRAGLISRVHKIPFSKFREQLFKPLEYIVFAIMNEYLHDYIYLSRHPHIAEIVFEKVLKDPREKFDEYIRILTSIDIDYTSDRKAFRKLTNAKHLFDIFRDIKIIRSVYLAARNRIREDSTLLQQEAIAEMTYPDGDLNIATEKLQKASNIAPKNKAIIHSLSELALKKAEKSLSPLEKKKFRAQSKQLVTKLLSDFDITPHSFHTLIKIGIDELKELLEQGDDATIERKIRDLEKVFNRAYQSFPYDSFILDAEALFSSLLEKNPKALQALKKAFFTNKSPYIASRLAKMHEDNRDLSKAIEVLSECLNYHPNDKPTNFRLAMLLMKFSPKSKPEIKRCLKASFIMGDMNYAAQFWYARCLYLEGDYELAENIFSSLENANVDIRTKKKPRGIIKEIGRATQYSGVILKVESSYAFVTIDGRQENIFTHRKFNRKKEWSKLKKGRRVVFNLVFNYRGPVAFNIKIEKKE